MTEILEAIFKALEFIPYNVSMIIVSALIIYFVRAQNKINEHFYKWEQEAREKLHKGATNFQMIDERFTGVEEHFEQVHDEMKSIYKMVLKDIIYNATMDLMERHDAYEEYISLGGNGFVRAYYERKIKPEVEEYIKDGHIR